MNHPAPRPVWLNSPDATRVTLDDNALVITVGEQAERWLPLARVSRIIANRHAHFSTQALLACAEQGITLLFLDHFGQPLARLMGRPGERQGLHQRLLDLMAHPDGADRYQDWLRANRRRVAASVLARIGLDANFRSHRDARLRLESTAAALGPPQVVVDSRRYLHGIANAWMLHHSSQLGLGADSEALQDGHPDLASDLGELLCWHSETLRIGFLLRRRLWEQRHGQAQRPLTRKQMLRLWQRNGNRMGRAGRDLSNRLHRWLVDSSD